MPGARKAKRVTGLRSLIALLRMPVSVVSCLVADVPIAGHALEWLLDSGTTNAVVDKKFIRVLYLYFTSINNTIFLFCPFAYFFFMS